MRKHKLCAREWQRFSSKLTHGRASSMRTRPCATDPHPAWIHVILQKPASCWCTCVCTPLGFDKGTQNMRTRPLTSLPCATIKAETHQGCSSSQSRKKSNSKRSIAALVRFGVKIQSGSCVCAYMGYGSCECQPVRLRACVCACG